MLDQDTIVRAYNALEDSRGLDEWLLHPKETMEFCVRLREIHGLELHECPSRGVLSCLMIRRKKKEAGRPDIRPGVKGKRYDCDLDSFPGGREEGIRLVVFHWKSGYGRTLPVDNVLIRPSLALEWINEVKETYGPAWENVPDSAFLRALILRRKNPAGDVDTNRSRRPRKKRA
jgi:hypothetical protein